MNRHTRSARNAPPPRKNHNGILLAAVIILMASLNLYAILGRDALSWDSAPAPYEPSFSDPAPIETVSLSDVPAQLSCGQQMQCSVAGTSDEVVWSSSDSGVISVENGTLTALRAGTAVITAGSSACQSSGSKMPQAHSRRKPPARTPERQRRRKQMFLMGFIVYPFRESSCGNAGKAPL